MLLCSQPVGAIGRGRACSRNEDRLKKKLFGRKRNLFDVDDLAGKATSLENGLKNIFATFFKIFPRLDLNL
jgi:hypothetical protein